MLNYTSLTVSALQVHSLGLPPLVLALCTTLSANAATPRKTKFLSSAQGKLPLYTHALVLVVVAVKLLYGMGTRDADSEADQALELPPRCDVVKSLRHHRNRLMTDEWGFSQYTETPLSHSAVFAASEAQGDVNHERAAKKRNTSLTRITEENHDAYLDGRRNDVAVSVQGFDRYIAFCTKTLPSQQINGAYYLIPAMCTQPPS